MRFYLGFVEATSQRVEPIGWKIIRWFQDSPIVHCFMAFEIPNKGLMVYETTETTYQKRSYSERSQGCKIRLFELKGNAGKAFSYCEALLGTPYDYPGIAFLGLILFTERLVNWIAWPLLKLASLFNPGATPMLSFAVVGNPYHLQQFMFCSEAAYHACSIAGFPVPRWWLGESITPRQFYRFMKDSGYKEI